MLFVVRPKESTSRSAWPGSSAGIVAVDHAARVQVVAPDLEVHRAQPIPARAAWSVCLPRCESARFAGGGWGSLAAIRHVYGYRRILMRRRFLGLGIGLGALLAFPATGMARTIDVFPGDSIQHAVHEARSGDVIKVHQGIYHGSVEITKNGLTLKGSGIDRNKGSLIKPGDTKRCGQGAAGICILAPQERQPQGPHQGHRDRGLPDPGIQGLRRGRLRREAHHASTTTSSSPTRSTAPRRSARSAPSSSTTWPWAAARPASTSATRRSPGRSCAATAPVTTAASDSSCATRRTAGR